MIDLKISDDIKELKESLNPAFYREALNEASNKIVGYTIEDTNKDIEDKWNINIKKTHKNEYVVASNIDGVYNKRGGRLKVSPASQGDNSILLRFKGEAINLSRFAISLNDLWYYTTNLKTGKLVKRRKAQKVKIKTKGGTTSVHGSFVAKMKSGHVGIFQRVNKDNSRKGRGKIVELRTITLPSMLHQVDFDGNLDKEWVKNIDKEFEKQYDRFASQGYI